MLPSYLRFAALRSRGGCSNYYSLPDSHKKGGIVSQRENSTGSSPILYSPTTVRELLKRYGLSATKRLGQNFLIDQNTLDKILAAADIDTEAEVLEIGTGLGTLTAELAKRATRVASIEIDSRLQPLLSETLQGYDNIAIIFADALKIDLNSLWTLQRPRYVVANLPYYITSPLLLSLLALEPQAKRIVVLVQKEVAERLTAPPGSKLYGSLTVWVGAQARVELFATVPATVFYPVPEVASAIMILIPKTASEHDIVSLSTFDLTNKALFGQRRKNLYNALRGSPYWHLPSEEILSAIQKQGLDPSMRGEQLSIKQIVALANEIDPKLCNTYL